MVKCELPKLELWVRFPSPAPFFANYIFVRYNKNMEELEKKEEIEITQENATETKVKKQTLVSQKVTMTAFGLSIFLIFLAAIFDVIAFKDTILTFIGGIIISAAAFVVLCILFLISFILIFGFYLVKTEGFWPLPLSIEFFKEVMGEVKVTAEQIAMFRIFRIILDKSLPISNIENGIANTVPANPVMVCIILAPITTNKNKNNLIEYGISIPLHQYLTYCKLLLFL